MLGGVTCPNCGKENPDFLDNCQFCQTALRREATLNIGEGPTKKSTGELEPILPDWLREARQQGRESAEEEAKKEATKPRIEKVEPPDLLAGLAFQAASDEDEVPDWLAAINPVEKKVPAPAKPAEEEPADFFAQFNKPAVQEPAQSETPKDELAGWLPQASEQPGEPSFDFGALGANDLNAPIDQEPLKPAEPEDLGWLHDLESSAKKPEPPKADMGWMSSSSQSSGEDLSWLNNLGGTPAPSFNEPASSQPQEDLGWLNNLGGTPAPSFDQPASSQPQEDLGWLNNLGGTPAPSFDQPASSQPQEDLGWLNNLSGTPAPSFNEPAPSQPQEDLGWLNNLGGTPAPSFDQPASSQPQEDLGWLNNLGGTPISPSSEPAQPSSSQEDLSWLNNLGGTPAPSFNEPVPSQPQEDLGWLNNLGGTPAPSLNEPASSQPQEDLGWLNNLGGTPAPSLNEPASSQPQEDLDWLNNLGGTPAPSFDQPASSQPQEDLGWLNNLGGTPAPSLNEPASSQPQEDLDWLNNLGGTPAPTFEEPAPAQPSSSQDDLSWLSNTGETPAAPSFNEPGPSAQPAESDWLKNIDNQPAPLSPAHTAPLSPEAAQSMPDWLREATQGASSMPPLGATSMDWITSHEKPADQTPAPTQSVPASIDKDIFATPSESAPLSNQDIDSLFAVDMPDWLSKPAESATDTTSTSAGIPSGVNDSLAPVNLPSWVQAMRPVEAAIGEVSAVSADQNTEKEGPLAGLRGVIPFAPIGSAQRPKSISLKLQASEEQQTTAALLEQILASETTARPLQAAPFVVSQRVLRWSLTAIFLIALGVMIGLGSQFMPVLVSAPQMTDISNMANTIQSIPESAPVLVVIDYEPALASELEAAAGPLLDQLVTARKPNLTFVSNSPNGAALAERLMTNTKLNQDTSVGGLGYQLDAQYFNLGYLPGGSAGVQGFIAQPKVMMPAATVNLFSDFAAVIVLTDHAESGLVWIEQVELMKRSDPALASQPLLMVASAQAGPLLQPYVSSKQAVGMVNGLADAVRFEYANNIPAGNRIASTYWDAFGIGILLAILMIIVGSAWSLVIGIRARRANGEQG